MESNKKNVRFQRKLPISQKQREIRPMLLLVINKK